MEELGQRPQQGKEDGHRWQRGRGKCVRPWVSYALLASALLIVGLVTAGFLVKDQDVDSVKLIGSISDNNVAARPVARTWKEGWYDYHLELKSRANEFCNSTVLFLGDSITEEMMGTSKGLSWAKTHRQRSRSKDNELRTVWQNHYEPLGSLNLGLSGDQTQHLLWRLENGELPSCLKPKVMVINIGTNNLGAGMSPPSALIGVEAVIQLLAAERPTARIILMALFPRCQNGSQSPWKAVDETNVLIYELAEKSGPNVHFLDCGQRFVETEVGDSGEASRFLSKVFLDNDFLHLTKEGLEEWATCITPVMMNMLNP